MKRKRRTKKRRHVSSNTLDGIEYLGDELIPTTVELLQYNSDEYVIKELLGSEDFRKYIEADYVSWFEVNGLSDVESISQISKNFGLHSFDIRELLADSKLVKIVPYDDVTFALISAYYINEEGGTEDAQLAFILGENFVISFNESNTPVYNEVTKAIINNNQLLRKKGADYLLYVLLNAVNVFNNEYILQSEDKLWQLEELLILQEEPPEILHVLRDQKKAFMIFKRFMSSLKEEYRNLLDNTNGRVDEENMVYFENLDDRYRTISSSVDYQEESVKSLIDLYNSNNAMRMNEIMKRLTLVATIFIPLTFLVGVWGMNFKFMPELEWEYGYLAAWIFFVALVLLLVFLMKKNKWF